MIKVIIAYLIILSVQIFGQDFKFQKEIIYTGDFIGSIGQVVIDSKENVYIGDLINNTIHLFSPNGKYIKQIGREGKGPGEFKYIIGVQIGQKDSLYILDGKLNRITIYSPDKYENPAYIIRIPSNNINFYVSSVGWLNGNSINNGLWIDHDNNYFVCYRESFSADNLNKPHYLAVYRLNKLGKFANKKPLIKIKDNGHLVIKGSGSSFSVGHMPFGQVPIIEIGNDGYLYYASSDILDIKAIDVSGNLKRKLEYEIKPVRIRESMWNKVINDSEFLTKKILNSSLTPLPEYKRLFDDFVVDDKGNIWVATNTEDENNYTWLVFDKNNNLLTKFKFPNSVMLKIIKQNYAYGIYTDEDGIQSVIKYKIINK